MREIKTQLGTSFGADFEESTWSFIMPKGYEVAAGQFYIVDKPVYDELLEALQELLECDYTSGTHLYCAQIKARNAIAKAGKKETI